jgi:predicted ATPase
MQERGDLIRDAKGQWRQGPTLNWDILPARVEAVITERIERLPRTLKQILRVASVGGEVFTTQAIAQILTLEKDALIGILSHDLDRRHRLVRAEDVERVGGARLSRYRFRHILFQVYLYDSLDTVERKRLHE